MGRLDGKVAVVTGSGRGIGRAIALRFAREGADIVVNDVMEENMKTTAAEIKALGRKVITVKADVSKKDEVQKMVDAAIGAFGKIDILVNNAGITRHAPFLEMTEKDWDDVMNTNLKGTFLCSQAVAKHMIPRRYGKIINLSSITGLGGLDGTMANYGPSKAGIANLTKAMAFALGEHGINVNAMAPGTILTEIGRTRRSPAEYEVFLEGRKKVTVLGRLGTVEDIANLALFLASDESSFITGQTIACDGGRKDKL